MDTHVNRAGLVYAAPRDLLCAPITSATEAAGDSKVVGPPGGGAGGNSIGVLRGSSTGAGGGTSESGGGSSTGGVGGTSEGPGGSSSGGSASAISRFKGSTICALARRSSRLTQPTHKAN